MLWGSPSSSHPNGCWIKNTIYTASVGSQLCTPLTFPPRNSGASFCFMLFSFHSAHWYPSTASLTSLSPTVVLGPSTSSVAAYITLTGTMLDATDTSGIIRTLRMELSSTCTATVSSANSVVPIDWKTTMVDSIKLQTLNFLLPVEASFGKYSFCADYRHNASPTFSALSSRTLLIGACFSVSPLLSSPHIHARSSPRTHSWRHLLQAALCLAV